jgi:ATP-dependent DNA helicase RecG
LDFQRGAPIAELRELFVALAMTAGGTAILGVLDSREIVGCPLSQTTFDHVMKAAHACGLEVQLKEVRVGSDHITIVSVPEVRGRIVTTPDGRLLRRVGSENLPLTGNQLARFVREREERSAEDESLARFIPGSFDLAAVNSALRADHRRPIRRREELARALVDLGVAIINGPATDPSVLRAAAVLFASDPRQIVPGAAIQLVRRTGVGPTAGPAIAREELAGPLVTLVDAAMSFIATNTRSYQVVVGTRRETWPEYPAAVLREAILNALAHRDYALAGSTVDITIWDDRIELQSPGPLPGHINLGNIKTEHYSRNRRIMSVLKLLGLVEEYGEGIDRMFSGMEERLMEPPIIVPTNSSVTVTLRNRFVVGIEDQTWLAMLGHVELSVPERLALLLAREEGGVTLRRLRSIAPEADARAVLAAAVAKRAPRAPGLGRRHPLRAVRRSHPASGDEWRGGTGKKAPVSPRRSTPTREHFNCRRRRPPR